MEVGFSDATAVYDTSWLLKTFVAASELVEAIAETKFLNFVAT
jgi:hypothetical protein